MGKGGMIGGWEPELAMPTRMRVIREVEPGLAIVSLDGAAPEYLISADWMRRHSQGVLEAFDAMLRRETEVWENEGGYSRLSV